MSHLIIKEFCAENFSHIAQAITAGVGRIELCDNLAEGGTTVSSGVLKHTIAYCHQHHVAVAAMIRPRGGDFIYSAEEITIMLSDIEQAKAFGSDAVVFGCLTQEHWLDEKAMQQLIAAAQPMDIVFHMAFDEIALDKQFAAIDWLAKHGVTRILTHGGPATEPIIQCLPHLQELVAHADGRLTIMPGGGITHGNYEDIVNVLKVKEIHGTKIVRLPRA